MESRAIEVSGSRNRIRLVKTTDRKAQRTGARVNEIRENWICGGGGETGSSGGSVTNYGYVGRLDETGGLTSNSVSYVGVNWRERSGKLGQKNTREKNVDSIIGRDPIGRSFADVARKTSSNSRSPLSKLLKTSSNVRGSGSCGKRETPTEREEERWRSTGRRKLFLSRVISSRVCR